MKPAAYLDLAAWPRRDAFDYFRRFDKPFFNVCTRLDVSRLRQAVGELDHGGLALAYHYIALRLCNTIEPFRYRIEGERVRVHPVVDGSTTVLREDGSFGFADLSSHADFEAFAAAGAAAISAARAGHAPFEPKPEDQARIHFTTLPWLHFTSFSHARNWGREDSVPKLAFGRIDIDGPRAWMPLSVEVHHALMDGLHVGRFVQAFEAVLMDPLPLLGAPPAAR
ncbi:MAG: CatA-like O-acetyltransferase [Pseudomonadota bacterium]